jgi:hypothetical protein
MRARVRRCRRTTRAAATRFRAPSTRARTRSSFRASFGDGSTQMVERVDASAATSVARVAHHPGEDRGLHEPRLAMERLSGKAMNNVLVVLSRIPHYHDEPKLPVDGPRAGDLDLRGTA